MDADVGYTTNGKHAPTSNHYKGLASDIESINGVPMTDKALNTTPDAYKTISDAVQYAMIKALTKYSVPEGRYTKTGNRIRLQRQNNSRDLSICTLLTYTSQSEAKMNRTYTLITCISIVLVMPSFSWSQNYSYRADRAKLLFGLSSPGIGSTIMTFAATESEGEDVTGTPEIIELSSGKVVSFEKFETFPSDANVSWIHDGREVVFESTHGIYKTSIELANSNPKRVVAGPTHGLAFSPSEGKMAYWKMGNGTTTLVVQEVPSGKVLHSWELPLSYGSEPSRFELAFVGENRIYARTFDRPDATPLKEFDLSSGKMKQIVSDCLALTVADGALYYLAGEGVKGEIYRFDQGVTMPVSSAPLYTGIQAVRKMWIILTGMRKSGILDLRTRQVIAQTSCDEVTIVEMGTPLYQRGNRLSAEPAFCSLHSPKPQAH